MPAQSFFESFVGGSGRTYIPNPDGFIKGIWHEICAIEWDLQAADSILVSCDSLLYLSLADVDDFDLVIDTPDENAISMQAEGSTCKRVLRSDGFDLLFRSRFPNLDKPIIGNGGEDVLCLFRGSYIMDYAFVAAIFSNWFLLLSEKKSYFNVPINCTFVSRGSEESVGEGPTEASHSVWVTFENGNIVETFLDRPEHDCSIDSSWGEQGGIVIESECENLCLSEKWGTECPESRRLLVILL